MHEHKQNQCKRKVKHRKNVMGLIIFCITVGIAFMFTYYQNLRKEISVFGISLFFINKFPTLFPVDSHFSICLQQNPGMPVQISANSFFLGFSHWAILCF